MSSETKNEDSRIYYFYYVETSSKGELKRKIVIAWQILDKYKVKYGASIYRKSTDCKSNQYVKRDHRQTAIERLQKFPCIVQTQNTVNPSNENFRDELRQFLYYYGCSSKLHIKNIQ
jgi:hypothetical protein